MMMNGGNNTNNSNTNTNMMISSNTNTNTNNNNNTNTNTNNDNENSSTDELSILSSAISDDDDDDEVNQILGNYSSQESTTTGDSTTGSSFRRKKNQPPPVVIDLETRNVYCAKLVMIGVLSITVVACAMATFLYTTNTEERHFHIEFDEFATEIAEESNQRIDAIFDVLKGISYRITSYTMGSNSTWPYITLPTFEFMSSSIVNNHHHIQWLSFIPFVKEMERIEWESYTYQNKYQWIPITTSDNNNNNNHNNLNSIKPYIFRKNKENNTIYKDNIPLLVVKEEEETKEEEEQEVVVSSSSYPFYAPISQVAPISSSQTLNINYNVIDEEVITNIMDGMITTGNGYISKPINLDNIISSPAFDFNDETKWPTSYIIYPIYEKLSSTHSSSSSSSSSSSAVNTTTTAMTEQLGGFLLALLPWHSIAYHILPDDIYGIIFVMRFTCIDQQPIEYTYQINGPNVIYLGPSNLHARPRWTLNEIPFILPNLQTSNNCDFSIHIYPSDDYYLIYQSDKPQIYTSIVVLIFLITALVFTWYECSVFRRQDKVSVEAARTNAIVDSFFPQHIRDRIMQGEVNDDEVENYGKTLANPATEFGRLFENGILATKPIADFFPAATIMFADIVGFNSWASTREPAQVFTLLETVYKAFDKIANRRRVFKVETVGDCYVAATGLPDPRPDHAIVMARFARDCLFRMAEVVQPLELSLGPDTAELGMRFGLNSGPVTGGVLRGEKSRFQLFGDTVNTASRIESTGAKNRIHVSKETADLLIEAGKSSWVQPREDLVVAKGKGQIQTYWLQSFVGSSECFSIASSDQSSNFGTSISSGSGSGGDGTNSRTNGSNNALGVETRQVRTSKEERLIGWNVDMLLRSLKQIIAMRGDTTKSTTTTTSSSATAIKPLKVNRIVGEMVLDEVQEVITLPSKASKYKMDPEEVIIPDTVIDQLTEYVRTIASMYRNNPFHSFHHASHVTQSVTKLLSRVVTPDAIDYDELVYKKKNSRTLHKYTFGITSDPLTQFACSFSALIHDVDHPGVPNIQLVKEQTTLASKYNNQSIAEQNSVDLAWDILMQPKFINLCNCIYTTQSELNHFRQLVVNSVMATDIVDKELGTLRKKRWEKAFSNNNSNTKHNNNNNYNTTTTATTTTNELQKIDINRKATIVIEHIIQAADVAHTMQHWHVYIKWNERYFTEKYQAYLDGRDENDPSMNWYDGELGFFDFYIIPLAKKLEDCGVFGVSSDECLNYAKANRNEWEKKGKDLVKQYLMSFQPRRTKVSSSSSNHGGGGDGGGGGRRRSNGSTCSSSGSSSKRRGQRQHPSSIKMKVLPSPPSEEGSPSISNRSHRSLA